MDYKLFRFKEKLRYIWVVIKNFYLNWKDKFLSLKVISGFILFVKSDGLVIELRNLFGKISPYLYNRFYKIFGSILLIFFTLLIFYGLFWRAPFSFPEHSIATIERGSNLSEIAQKLENENFLLSSMWFKVFVTLVGGQRQIIAGDYYFEDPISVFTLYRRLLRGHFGLTQLRVYIPEGLNVREIADQIALTLPKFNKTEFITLAEPNEGYLFPDTYFFTPNQKPAEIISFMKDNFARQIKPYYEDIVKSGRSLEDIIKMASVVQNEAAGSYDARLISGIFWKRISLDMPMQADSTLRYVSGKASHEITRAELEDKSNPYNSYIHKGLPPTPISNPGIDSIKAAIAPTNSEYLFFFHDANGKTYFSVDFESHRAKANKYIR